MRLLLLEHRSAFAARLASALAEGGLAECDCSSLGEYEQHDNSGEPMRYDAIVLDLRRDAANSLRLCRHIVQLAHNTPVIAITALDDLDDAVRMVQAGAEEVCLRTEFEPETLRNRIQYAIQRRRVASLIANEVLSPTAGGGCDPIFEDSSDITTDASDESEPSVLQLACLVASDETGGLVGEPLRAGMLGIPVDISHLDCVEELVEHVTACQTDAAVLVLNEVDAQALDAIATVKAHNEQAVIVVAAPDLEGDLALTVIQHGADDVILLADPLQETPLQATIVRYLRQGLARRHYDGTAEDYPADPLSVDRASGQPSDLQIRAPRYDLTKSVIVIPISTDHKPVNTLSAEGFTTDVSEGGIAFEVNNVCELPTDLVMVGVEDNDGVYYYATMEIRHRQERPGSVRLGTHFVTDERDLLRSVNLTPTFSAELQQFTTRLPNDILHEWSSVGVLRPKLVDRIYVCPKCDGMPTFRSGCRSCGSIHVASHQLIHHFECSYLGRINEFEADGTVICPKCGTQGQIDSDHFQRLSGPCHCLDCNWSDSDTEVVGQCMRCNWHFPLKSASERELIAYHVNRLDPNELTGS